MTRKEKTQLAALVSKIIETTDILHPPSATILYNDIMKATDDQILDILTRHMDYIQIFEVYNRYDKQASCQDIDTLLSIINGANSEGI